MSSYSIRNVSELPKAFPERPKVPSHSIRPVSELPRAVPEHPRMSSYSIRIVSEPSSAFSASRNAVVQHHSQSVPECRRTAFKLSLRFPGHSRATHMCRTAFGIVSELPTAFQSVVHSQSVPECCRTAFVLSVSVPGQFQSVPECCRTTIGLSQSFPECRRRP